MPRIIEDVELERLDRIGLVRDSKGERVFQPKIEQVKPVDTSQQQITELRNMQAAMVAEIQRLRVLEERTADQVSVIQSKSVDSVGSWQFSFKRNGDGNIESVIAKSEKSSWEMNISRDSDKQITDLTATKL